MRAAVYYRNSDVRVEEVPRPVIGAGEILVRIEASGICGSDVMEWYRIKKAPLVLGHEVAGEVVETGAGVTAFKTGDRVTIAHHVPCNACRFCLAGNHSVCDTLRKTNFDPGGFAEFVRVPAINVDRGVYLLPDGMSFEEGSFSEPLGCVVRGFRKSGFSAGKSVLVIGSGISGILHVKLAKALGAGVIMAVDISEKRLKMARDAGADACIKATGDLARAVREANSGRLADFVAVCAAADQAIDGAFKSVERGGTILFFAPKEPGATFPLPVFDLWRDNVTMVNSYASCPTDTITALDLVASGRVKVTDMITHRLGLKDSAEGFRLVAFGGDSLKVIINPGA